MRLCCGQLALGLTWALVVGCGGSPPAEPLAPVGGKLLVDAKPLDGIVITFTPDIAKNSRGGIATTGSDGAFTVTDLTQNLPGLAPGRYTLSYSRMRLPDGSAPPEPGPGQEVDPGMIKVETLPQHLVNPDPRIRTNAVEIPPEGNTSLQLQINTR
jgi:hypothetical protein